jgi:hypothetical protein
MHAFTYSHTRLSLAPVSSSQGDATVAVPGAGQVTVGEGHCFLLPGGLSPPTLTRPAGSVGVVIGARADMPNPYAFAAPAADAADATAAAAAAVTE